MQPGKKWFIVSVTLAIIMAGYIAAGFTMRTTDTAPFCGNCHAMHDPVRTHQQSVHATLTCNQCHAPGDSFIRKTIFKTRSGMHDIYVNTLGLIPDVIEAKNETKNVINENCIDCHFMTTLNVRGSKDYCVECHRNVPHFSKSPISTRKVSNE